jgi:hypothetical protein
MTKEVLAGWGIANYVAEKLTEDINPARDAWISTTDEVPFDKLVQELVKLAVGDRPSWEHMGNLRSVITEVCERFVTVMPANVLMDNKTGLLLLEAESRQWYFDTQVSSYRFTTVETLLLMRNEELYYGNFNPIPTSDLSRSASSFSGPEATKEDVLHG